MPSKRDTLFSKLSDETQKAVNKFIDEYKRVLEQGETATTKVFEQTQEQALGKLADYESLESAYNRYTQWRQENKRTPLDEDNTEMALGYIVNTDIVGINRDFKPDESDKKFILKAYTDWITSNDFVPADDVLAHFSRIPELVFEEVRNELVGFVLEESDNGYQVKERPNPYLVRLLELIPDNERNEASKLLEELLEA